MKFSILVTSLVSSTAVAQTTFHKVVKDIHNVTVDVVTLNGTIAGAMQGTTAFATLAMVQTETTTLMNDTQTLIDDTKASKPFGKIGSNHVAAKVGKLIDSTISLLSVTVAQEPFFRDPTGACAQGTNFDSTILSSLQAQKDQSDQLGAALFRKLDKPHKKSAPAIQQFLDSKFDAAISFYQTAVASSTCSSALAKRTAPPM